MYMYIYIYIYIYEGQEVVTQLAPEPGRVGIHYGGVQWEGGAVDGGSII